MRRRLHAWAKDRPAVGVKRLHTRRRRDGLVINRTQVRRLSREEQLQLQPRRRRRRASTVRLPRAEVGGPNERWAMDCRHDVLATGQPVRVVTLVDVSSRECVALEVAKSCSGAAGARMLRDAGDRVGGLPPIIPCDHGTECTSTALDPWASWTRGLRDCSRPGKPVDHSVCEAVTGSVRRECLTRHGFASRLDAQTARSTWRADSNNLRPHTRLGLQSPAPYRARGDDRPRSLR